jgi:hypothetical protein
VFGWLDPNTGFDQSEHALYTCYFTKVFDWAQKSRSKRNIFMHETWDITFVFACHTKTSKHGNKAIGKKKELIATAIRVFIASRNNL